MNVGPDPPPSEADRIRSLIEAQPAPDGVGIEGALGRVCRAAVVDLELSGVTVTLLPSSGTHVVAGASDEAARAIEELQFDAGEGPTMEAARTSTPVVVPDMVGQALGRWPGLVEAAAAAGVGAVFALPLHLGASKFGTMTLYRTATRTLEASQMRAALIYAEIAIELLVDSSLPQDNGPEYRDPEHRGPAHTDPADASVAAPDIDRALDAHNHVYQAQGMVMVQLGVGLPEALARMRAHAYSQHMTLAILSTGILQGAITLTKGDE